MCRTALLNTKENSGRSVFTTTRVLCSILALMLGTSAAAQEPTTPSIASDDANRQQLQTVIETRDSEPLDTVSRSNTSSVITQIGNDNRANIAQSRNRAAFASGNYASITQRGTSNEANIIQSGSNNVGLIGQSGREHEAKIEQAGNGFEARINQRGIKSNIDISQSGSGLRSISVRQNSVSGMTTPITIRTN